MIGDLGIEPHLNDSMRLKGLLVVMTTPSEKRGRPQLGCHHDLAQRARDLQLDKKLLLLAYQLNRVQVDYISVFGIHLRSDLVGIASCLPSLALKIQHLGVKDLSIPLPHYFQF